MQNLQANCSHNKAYCKDFHFADRNLIQLLSVSRAVNIFDTYQNKIIDDRILCQLLAFGQQNTISFYESSNIPRCFYASKLMKRMKCYSIVFQ